MSIKKFFKNLFSKRKKVVDYRRDGIGGWKFIQHIDIHEDPGPIYIDTYQHSDGRKTNVYDDEFADNEELDLLIKEQNDLNKFNEIRKKQVGNIIKFIFITHWVLVGIFFVISIPQYSFWCFFSFLAYCLSFIAGFGFGVGFINNFYSNKKEEIVRLLILFFLLILGFLLISWT